MQATLSQFIKDDILDQIGSRTGLRARLTLTALSSHYGVSFTPVREALRNLIADGVLVKQDNGRIQLNPNKVQVRSAKAKTTRLEIPSRSVQLTAALGAEVIDRSLRGVTDYLREEATAERYRVGRTAIRQVFNRLAGQGLIIHVPRCGWRVRTFDLADLKSYLQTREALELQALELAQGRLVQEDLQRMLAGNVADSRSPRLDNQIHRYLVDKAGNAYIRDFFDRHGTYYTTLFDYAAPGTRAVKRMAEQHREILKALIERDWRRARRALSHHIRSQQPVVEELMRQLGRPTINPKSPEDCTS